MYPTDLFVLLGACLLLLAFTIYADAVSLSNVLNVEDQARLKQTFYNAMPFKDLETAGYAVFSLKLMNAEVPPTQVIKQMDHWLKSLETCLCRLIDIIYMYAVNCIILLRFVVRL